jgi:hypothetical protein
MHLTVIHPFGNFKRGDKITDPAEISKIVEGTDGVPHDNAHHVVKTADQPNEQ